MEGRISPVSREDALALGREMGIAEAQAGRSAFRMLANHPDLVREVYGLLRMLSNRNRLDTRLRELMIMRIAWTTGSAYEWFQHYRIATTTAGLSPDEIVAVRDWRRSDLLGSADRAVLAAVDDTIANGRISDAVWAECVQHLKDSAVLVEMVVAIGNWIMFSQLLRTLEVPIEEGGKPWPPDGISPPGAV